MKSTSPNKASNHLELVYSVYSDACAKCPADVSDLRDLDTLRSRVEHEGLSFLTITLPSFCKIFERSLALGHIDPAMFRIFHRGIGEIPAFLQGILGHVFNRETGRIYEDANTPIFVEAVRQICLLFKKVEIACTPERDQQAIDNFVEIERELSVTPVSDDDTSAFAEVSHVLWDHVFGDFHLDTVVPRHGPGKTSERISGNQKYNFRFWHERLEPYFPFFGNAVSNSAAEDGEAVLKRVTFLDPDHELPVRVVLVPKTLKSPRVIAIEPVCMQYTQQGLQAYLYDKLETSWLTRGHLNFRDQSINQEIALTSSRTGQYATIDLSDASDRVFCDLALRMFDHFPDLQGAIEACRSTSAVLPDGRVISPLRKFASMGSALCFPIEAMYFYTICVVALLRKRGLSTTHQNVHKVTRDVYVYGDDIIVPTDEAGVVLDHLQKYHCKVNTSKTFYSGRFRESCGVDGYDGQEVTPTYLGHLAPENKQQVQEIISWVSTANLFYKRGYWRTASLMFAHVERYIGPLPYVSEDSPGLGRISYLGYRTVERWRDGHPWPEVRAMVAGNVYRSDRIDGYSALQKCLLRMERKKRFHTSEQARYWFVDMNASQTSWIHSVFPEEFDSEHLERTAPRGAVTLKRRWVPAT